MSETSFRVLGLVFVLAVVGAIGWSLTTLSPRVLFWCYAGIGVLVVVMGFAFLTLIWRRRSPLDPNSLETEALRALISASRFDRFRLVVAIVAGSLAEALAWPAGILCMTVTMVKHGLLKQRPGGFAFLANLKLNQPTAAVSVGTAVMVASLFALDWASSSEFGYRHITLLMLGLSVALKHLASFVNTQSLAKSLRTSLADPYLSFIVIGIADLGSLILAFASYSAANAGEHVTLHHLRATASDIFTLAHIRAGLFSDGTITWFQALTGVAGGLYWITGFKSIVKYQEFARTDEDLHAIASGNLLTGDYRAARKWLDKVKQPDALTYELFCSTYLAADDIAAAQHAAESYAVEKKLSAAARKSEVSRLIVLGLGITPVAKEQLSKHIRSLIAGESQEAFFPTLLEGLLRQKRFEGEELLDFFDNDEACRRHALALAAVAYYAERNAEELLRAYVPTEPAGHIIHFALVYRCLWVNAISDTTAKPWEAVNQWTSDKLEEIKLITKRLPTDYERVTALEYLYLACDLADNLGLAHKTPLNEIATAIRDEIGGADRILQLLRVVDGSRKGRQDELSKQSSPATAQASLRGEAEMLHKDAA